MSTLKDVAKLAGVSYSTVSLVLNGRAEERKISKITQDKVYSAANELHYVVNIAARKLKSAQEERYSVAFFWPDDYRISFVSRLITGIYSVLMDSNDKIDFVICPYKIGHLSSHAALLVDGHYHGAVIASASEPDLEYLESTDFPIPIVLLNRDSKKYCTVGTDNYAAGQIAAKYLIGCGFTDVATVFSAQQYTAMNQHQLGFIDTWEKEVGQISKRYICQNTITGGYNFGIELFKGPLPQVLFCDTDAISRGLLCAANESGKIIPDDLSILSMGVYSPESSAFTVPPLTTVEIPHELFAKQGFEILMSQIRKEITQPCHMFFDPELRIRASCQPISK